MIQIDRYAYPHFVRGHIDMSQYDYPRASIKNDDEAKIMLMKVKLLSNPTVYTKKQFNTIVEKFGENLDDNAYIWAFDNYSSHPHKLIDPKLDIIKREDWALDLCGETLEILNHPAFTEINKFIAKNAVKFHDLLIVYQCSAEKPYSSNTNYTLNNRVKRLNPNINYDIAVLSNSGVIPIDQYSDYSYCYPFRHYNWNHMAEEGKGLRQAVEDKMHDYLFNFITSLGYKKVAIVARMVYPSYYNIYQRLKSELPDVDFYWPHTEDHIDEMYQMYNVPKSIVPFYTRYTKSSLVLKHIFEHFFGRSDFSIDRIMYDVNSKHPDGRPCFKPVKKSLVTDVCQF